MNESSTELPTKSEVKPEEQREKICISISEGCIRHYNEEPEIEEQFILRLPEREAKVVHEALENDTLEKRLNICVQRNQRDASVSLDGKQLNGRIMNLPTIIESYKLADESTLYKTADISQILVCSNAQNKQLLESDKKHQIVQSSRNDDYKYSNGLCPPLKNARNKRFRKIQLEENFDPNVDRAVKLLLRADGAAESVRFEIAYEDPRNVIDKPLRDTNENPSNILSTSNEFDVFGETLSVSSGDDVYFQNNNDVFDANYPHNDSSFDSDIGNIENYDLETLTEEQKQYLAQLKEIDWCLSNFDFKISSPHQTSRGGGCGRGRGRPRMHGKPPKQYKSKNTKNASMAGRGGRGRPPGRGRGRG